MLKIGKNAELPPFVQHKNRGCSIKLCHNFSISPIDTKIIWIKQYNKMNRYAKFHLVMTSFTPFTALFALLFDRASIAGNMMDSLEKTINFNLKNKQ